ncbi:MAG: hypothetical protein FWC40_04245 [Proteobacteria bacterium]|nr:hypothetical protein [Pseudomonadota bacterium]
MNFLRNRVVTLLCAAWVFAAFSPSTATAQNDEFSRHMMEGIRLFNEGKSDSANYLKAIEVFIGAKRINPIPDVTYNIARSYHLYGNCTQALAHYYEYQSLVRSVPDAKDVRSFVSELERTCYGTLVLRCRPANATVSIDNAPPVKCDGTHTVAAGERNLVIATSSGRFVNRMASVTSGKTLELEVSIHEGSSGNRAPQVIAMPGPPLSERTMLWVGVGIAGVGVASALTGGILLGNAYEWDWVDAWGEDDYKRNDGMYRAGWALAGIGVGATVLGIVLMVVDTVQNSGGDTIVGTRPIVPSVVFHDGGATAGVTLTF